MTEPLTEMQAIEAIKDIMNQIEYHTIYFTFKSMKIKHIRKPTVETMRACLALHLSGLPVTSSLLSHILDFKTKSQMSAIVGRLHQLGDKHCLTLKRMGSGGIGFEWAVNPVFLKHYEDP